MIGRIQKSLPGLLIALLGVGMAWWIVNVGWLGPIALAVLGFAVGAGCFELGKRKLPNDPKGAVVWMEWSALSPFLLTSFIAAVVVWVGIYLEPDTNATVENKKLLGGLSGAVTAFLGAAFVKASEDTDTNWVASEVKAAFQDQYTDTFRPGTNGYRAIYSPEIEGITEWVGRSSRTERARMVAEALQDGSQLAPRVQR